MPTYRIEKSVEYYYFHEIEADNLEEALTKISETEFPIDKASVGRVYHNAYSRNTVDGEFIDRKEFRATCEKLGLIYEYEECTAADLQVIDKISDKPL